MGKLLNDIKKAKDKKEKSDLKSVAIKSALKIGVYKRYAK